MVKRGVRRYRKGRAQVEVGFPEGVVACQYCRYCKPQYRMDYYRCNITDEMLFFIDNEVGQECPLELEEVERDV